MQDDAQSDKRTVPLDGKLAQERAHAKSNLNASLAEQQRVTAQLHGGCDGVDYRRQRQFKKREENMNVGGDDCGCRG
eukprot:CAMPEP_0204000440 /NCGR_PEP_ID=MMETSP0360-20130528/15365_1 /ASSEMBLY_ACC=CAM_ASM_000342 /TAXON_ID=268821 /ORGANISM="Scrippsiella Hangoei, Strain SHTV-5" /LENGTH=76 /DNA_ID=CAMNT_0050941745 /DNA_START=92 /DNA_END=320 /DNA_ORIENTATION=+